MYTFYVGGGSTIPFPYFTTDPTVTPYSASKFNLIVDGITLCSSGITVSSLSWLVYDSNLFTINSLTSDNVGTHSFQV
jgi:hypothetical protein